MHTEIKDYISYELYPALYERLAEEGVLDEFKFTKKGDRYVSTTDKKHSGRTGKTKGQVVVYENNPAYLIDHSESPRSQDIIGYVQHIQSGEDIGLYNAINKLATMAKIKPYSREQTEEEKEEYKKQQRAAKVWEAVVNYCIQCIKDPQYKEEAAPVVDYLITKRKYTIQDITTMQLGYLPSKEGLFSYLKKEGITDEEVKNIVKLSGYAGATHKLTIPVRNAAGKIKGLALRDVNHVEGQPYKYLYSTDINKSEALFNLYTKAKNKRVVLVEGQLDAAIVQARGYEYASIAAIGGKSISKQQIDHLIKAGAEEVYICLDNEESTAGDLKKTVEALNEVEQLGDRLFIVELPAGIKDVDQLVTVKGIEAFNDAVKTSAAYYAYYADKRIEQYRSEEPTDKAIQDLTDDILRIATTIKNPVLRDDLKGLFTKGLQSVGIQASEESFKAAVDRIKYKDDQAKQDEEFKAALKKAEDQRKSGDVGGAITYMGDNLRSIKLRDKLTEFQQLDNTIDSEVEIAKRISNQPDSVATGYTIQIERQTEEISFKANQLTIIAAPSGHGKTAFLINAGINIIKRYPAKEVYLFTFEEPGDNIKLYALNTFMNEELNKGIAFNKSVIKDYFKGDGGRYIANDKKRIFEEKKADFFANILPRFKIIRTEYSADELIEYIEYIKKRTDNAVILIDYIQKLRSDKKGSITARPTELKLICDDLDYAAIRTGLPIALGAQFNRDVKAPLDMAGTSLAEASDIEKTASEIYALWNSTKEIERKLDKNEVKTLLEEYGIVPDEFKKSSHIIFKILKSRSLPAGYYKKLGWNGNTGAISNEAESFNKPAGPKFED
jgi:hypothetical protein